MIASACLAAQLPPTAFGVDPEDVPTIAEEIIALLREHEAKERERALLAKLGAR
jgi:hypothetical protein